MKKRLTLIIVGVLMALMLQTVAFAAEYTREEKYGIDRSWIEQSSDGSLVAGWSNTLYSTRFVILVKYGGRPITKEITVSGNEYDITELVQKKGKGTYSFVVYPQSGGPSLSLTSDGFEVDNAVYNAVTRCINKRNTQQIEESRVVQSVDLKLQEKKVKAGEVRPVSFSDGTYFTVRSVAYSKPLESWIPGDTVQIVLLVDPVEGYSFSNPLKVTCSKAEKVTVAKDGSSAKVTLTYIPYAALAKPHLLYVDEDGVLHWERVAHAQAYVISIKQNGEEINRLNVKGLSADLSSYIPVAGSLSVEMYSNGGNNSYNYVDSSKIKIDNLELFLQEYTIHGTFEKESRGWRYSPVLSEEVLGWKKLGQDWYYFDEDGYAKKPGWFMDRDGSWYYFNQNSRALASEWLQDKDGSWYYFGDDCRMFVNRKTPDGYVVGADGRWIP